LSVWELVANHEDKWRRRKKGAIELTIPKAPPGGTFLYRIAKIPKVS